MLDTERQIDACNHFVLAADEVTRITRMVLTGVRRPSYLEGLRVLHEAPETRALATPDQRLVACAMFFENVALHLRMEAMATSQGAAP